jgi:hypothetical protein
MSNFAVALNRPDTGSPATSFFQLKVIDNGDGTRSLRFVDQATSELPGAASDIANTGDTLFMPASSVAIGNPVTGGTPGSVLFVGPTGLLAQDNTNLNFNDTTNTLTAGNITLLGSQTFPDDVRQTFNPGATVAGLNVGAVAADPSTPINGDIWYESANNLLRARIGGATVSLGIGSVTGSGTAGRMPKFTSATAIGNGAIADNGATALLVDSPYAILLASGANNAGLKAEGDGVIRLVNNAFTDFNRLQFGGITNSFPSLKRTGADLELRLADDSAIGSVRLAGINDTNGNELVRFSPTASAVNEFTITNGATGAPGIVTLSATGGDADIRINVIPKGTASLNLPNGTAANPILTLGDATTGFYRSAINEISLTIAGAQAFRFDAGGSFTILNNGLSVRNITLIDSSGNLLMGLSSIIRWSTDTGLNRAAAGVSSFNTTATTIGGTFRAIATTPAQITADQNNYNPAGSSLFQRWSSDASRNITGLVFSAAQVDGQVHYIWNVGAQNIVLVNESASSTAANRFTNSTGADITLGANKVALVQYDGTTSRWRVTLLP